MNINKDSIQGCRTPNCLPEHGESQSSGEAYLNDASELAKLLDSQTQLSHDQQSHDHNNRGERLSAKLNNGSVLQEPASIPSGADRIPPKTSNGLNKEGNYSKSSDCVTSGSKRRPSVVLVDSSGNLQVLSAPSNGNCAEEEPDDSSTGIHRSVVREVPETEVNKMSPSSPSVEPSQSTANSHMNQLRPRTKHAPKIMYSHSEDKLMTSADSIRPICPSLPYSPYASPSSSPRLQRQPTRETRRLSFTESGDGWTQLNQYKLKDEIGKVSAMRAGSFHCLQHHFFVKCLCLMDNLA